MTSSVTVKAYPGDKLDLKVTVFERETETLLTIKEQMIVKYGQEAVFHVYPPRMIQVEEVPSE
jgi:hypothetical protein